MAFFCFSHRTASGVKLQHISLECQMTHSTIYTPPPPTDDPFDDASFHTGIYGNILMPLAQFRSIETLIIDVMCKVQLTDGNLSSLVSAWPHLRTFSLNNMHGWTNFDITQVGLLRMLECCPSLETLCIAINTNAFTQVPLDRPGRGVQNTNI